MEEFNNIKPEELRKKLYDRDHIEDLNLDELDKICGGNNLSDFSNLPDDQRQGLYEFLVRPLIADGRSKEECLTYYAARCKHLSFIEYMALMAGLSEAYDRIVLQLGKGGN